MSIQKKNRIKVEVIYKKDVDIIHITRFALQAFALPP